MKTILLFGLLLFAIVYAGMAFNHNLRIFFLLFFIYGMYAAATDGVSKAWISNLVEKKQTSTAIGTFTAFQSICTMLASVLGGWLLLFYGFPLFFILSSLASLLAFFYIFIVV